MDEKKPPRKWTLEEIDELLQDSGMLPREDNSEEAVEDAAPTPKASGFNPRAGHNDGIDHKIITDPVERSDGDAEPQVYGSFVSDKYRDKFFNRPAQNLDRTADHTPVAPEDQRYERGGFVRKKSNFTPTAEFTPVPNLVPDHKAEGTEGEEGADVPTDRPVVLGDASPKTKTIALRSLAVTDGDAHDIAIPEEEDDAQLSFEGFHTPDVEIVDEQQVEEDLARRRKAKVSGFTIASEITHPEEEEEVKRYGTDEYRTADDKFKVKYYLKKKKATALVGTIVSFVSVAVLVATSLYSQGSTGRGIGAILLTVLFTLVPVAVNFSFVLDGIKAIKGFKFNKNTGCFIAIVASLIQDIVLLVSDAPFETGAGLFASSAVLSLALNMAGENIELKRIIDNFEYLSSNENIYSVNYIEKTETAFEIGRGLLLDDPAVLSSQKTLFPRRFIELSRKYYPSDDMNKKLVPIGVIASLLVGALTLLVTKDIRNTITAFTGSVCVSVPYFSYIANCVAIAKTSKKTLSKGAMLSGWQTNKVCEEANAVAVDSADVFDSKGGNVYGIHPFYDIQIDEAIIYTATLAIASGGPLGNLFKRVIVGETSLLPPVDSLAYEEKLGFSAWIFNRRILVGNEDLLRNHNVEIPDTALIAKHLKTDRYPLYLAIDGKAASVFIVSYDADPHNAPLLRVIEKNSISLLVRSDDANITDEMVSSKVGVHQSGVKILSAVSGDIYKTYVKETTTAADALLLHDGTAHSFLFAIKSALSLGAFKQMLKTVQVCAMGVGIAIVAVLSFVSGLQSLSALSLLILQGFFTALSVFAVSGSHAIKSRKKK